MADMIDKSGAFGKETPAVLNLHSMASAMSRLRRLLAEASEGQTLDRLVPPGTMSDPPIRRRSAWSSTFLASLELARQGEAALTQEAAFSPIHISSNLTSPL